MSDRRLRIAIAQLNFTVGDIAGNSALVAACAQRARREFGAELVVYPELALTAYPPEDLLLRPGLHEQVARALNEIKQHTSGIHLLVGLPWMDKGALYNACAVVSDGHCLLNYKKQHLPNYSVFDEKRYFQSASDAPNVFTLNGVRLGVSICEDLWQHGPALRARHNGAQILININASPFHRGKAALREQILRKNIQEVRIPIVYANLVGGQDELVFDGASMVMNAQGEIVFRAPQFRESLDVIEFEVNDSAEPVSSTIEPLAEDEQCIYDALVLGIRDYVNKNGFSGAVVGISGGIDSALTLALAADALGADRVEAVSMPSQYTASMSVDDACEQARRLGVGHHVVPIEPAVRSINACLAEIFAGAAKDVTEENIQARCRGVLLMAISNKQGRLVLATGNKSEMSVGYATLYGDMAGGFAPLKDVSKLLVYRLARWRNRHGEIIPQRVIDRPPTAELAPNQKDEDSLPPYEMLDPILERYIELDQTPREIVAAGFDPQTVACVAQMVDKAEYKRRQAAPGVRVTERAFGKDRRFPITSRYSEI